MSGNLATPLCVRNEILCFFHSIHLVSCSREWEAPGFDLLFFRNVHSLSFPCNTNVQWWTLQTSDCTDLDLLGQKRKGHSRTWSWCDPAECHIHRWCLSAGCLQVLSQKKSTNDSHGQGPPGLPRLQDQVFIATSRKKWLIYWDTHVYKYVYYIYTHNTVEMLYVTSNYNNYIPRSASFLNTRI